jgi:hypothetical protein
MDVGRQNNAGAVIEMTICEAYAFDTRFILALATNK